jgi:uncharacterized protein
LKVCHDVLGDKAIGVSIRTELQPTREYEGSDDFIAREGIPHLVDNFNDFSLPCFRENPPDRCYHCKYVSLDLDGYKVGNMNSGFDKTVTVYS